MLDQGADVNATNYGATDTIAKEAASYGHPRVQVELLLARGANPNTGDNTHCTTALMEAAAKEAMMITGPATSFTSG